MDVLVKVAFPDLETRTSEKAWDDDIVNAVATAVYADKTLDTRNVRQLENKDCTWILERGMAIPGYDVTVGGNGSWHSGVEPFPVEPEARGDDLQSLFDYLVGKGLVSR